jgi:hypothetical protein
MSRPRVSDAQREAAARRAARRAIARRELPLYRVAIA